jgi:hypothetical protein
MKCLVSGALRCWEYRASTDSVPLWVLPHVMANGAELKFCWPDNGGERILRYGDHVVDLPGGHVVLFASLEFNRLFKVCAEDRPSQSEEVHRG